MLPANDTSASPSGGAARPTSRTLVLGVGNPLRGDDGVGWMVAQHLTRLGDQEPARPNHPGFKIRTVRGDAVDLVEAWSDAEEVILIDAGLSGSRPGTVHRFDAIGGELPAHWECASTHGLGVAAAVELARALGRLPRRLLVYVIEGESFAPGSGLTHEVRRAAYRLIEELENQGAG